MMPAGKYWIGDLCYVLDEVWDDVCKFICSDTPDGEFTLPDGRKFASYGTAYGDGSYESNIGTLHPVDSGTIGCIKVEDLGGTDDERLNSLGAIVEFSKPFKTADEDGVITFGHVEIDTEPPSPPDFANTF